MSFMLEVSLISGKSVSLETHEDESVESFRMRAQKAGKGRLLDSTGSVLDEGDDPIKKARLQYQEPLTLRFGGSMYSAARRPLLRTWGMVAS